MKHCTLDQARAAKPHALKLFERLGKVAGVGITRVGEAYGLKVNFVDPLESQTTVPAEVDGVPVKVEVVGPVRKRATGA